MKRRGLALLAVALLVLVGVTVGVVLLIRDDDGSATEEPGPEVAMAFDAPSAASPEEQADIEDAVIAGLTKEDFLEAGEPEPNPARFEPDPGGVAPAPTPGGSTESRSDSSPSGNAPGAAGRGNCRPRQVRPRGGYMYARYCVTRGFAAAPVKAIGVLYYTIPGEGLYRCTATAAGTGNAETPGNESVLVTAAHCVGDTDSRGRWVVYKGHVWFPEEVHRRIVRRIQSSTNAEFKTLARRHGWFARFANSSRAPIAWLDQDWIDGKAGSWAYDFAAIVMDQREGASISVARNGLGVDMAGNGANASVSSYGNPSGPPFRGKRLYICEGATKPGDGITQRPPLQGVLGLGCDMTGGSSGGPWLAVFTQGQELKVVSVNSYGQWVCPENKPRCVPKSQDNLMFGPNLVLRHWWIFDAARKFDT